MKILSTIFVRIQSLQLALKFLEVKLLQAKIFRINYAYPTYNKDTHKIISEEGLQFDSKQNCYIQSFKIVELSAQESENVLNRKKEEKRLKINKEVSEAILAGFNYEVQGQELHFKYDLIEQSNFTDKATEISQSNIENIEWTGYMQEESRALNLSSNEFLDLYLEGALKHKNTLKSEGTKRKALVQNATSLAEIEQI